MERTPEQSPYVRSERQEFVHRLVQEFRDHLTTQEYQPDPHSEAVVVLSAPQEILPDGTVNERSSENVVRIEYGAQAVRQITAQRLEKDPAEVTPEDIIAHGPKLILNGETEQLPMMNEVASDINFPVEATQSINCGDRGKGNTRTQFEQLRIDPAWAKAKSVSFITTSYHVPRVARTADKNLEKSMGFEVIGVPLHKLQYNVYRKVRGEVKRILAYSAKGDATREFAQPATPLVEFGENIDELEYSYQTETADVTPDALGLRTELENSLAARATNGDPVPFNGPLANVTAIEYTNGRLSIDTNQTDYYTYLAASYAHRENQTENPIRPLAVSATILNSSNEILFEERNGLTEMEDKFHVFGGSLRPGEHPDIGMRRVLEEKLGIPGNPSLEISGLDNENVQNIAEVFYLVHLDAEQEAALKDTLEKRGAIDRLRTMPSGTGTKEIEKRFGIEDLTDWNPSGFYNVMYGLVKSGQRSAEEIQKIVDSLQRKINRKPFRYSYPIETYVGNKDGQS